MNIKSLNKRSWNPFVRKDTGKWYTGYDGRMNATVIEELDEAHEVRTLTLTPIRTSRGRSSANMIFEDKDGHTYIMGLDGGFKLIKKLLKGEIKSEGEYLICDFVQVKRGTNLFIEAVEEE